MTVQALAWAMDQPIPAQPKLVLLALANHAEHETGRVHFDASTIAREASIAEKSLWRYLGALERNGYLAKDEHNGASKRDYWLQLDIDPARQWSWTAQDGADTEEDAASAAPTTSPAPVVFRRESQAEARKAATAPPPGRPEGQVAVVEGTEAFRAWCAWYRERRMITPFVQAVVTVKGEQRRGFYQATLFPPEEKQIESLEGTA